INPCTTRAMPVTGIEESMGCDVNARAVAPVRSCCAGPSAHAVALANDDVGLAPGAVGDLLTQGWAFSGSASPGVTVTTRAAATVP
ncbi:MAG: hypothetical protein AAF458_05415, partial [Pseudomonadota bacterium]